MATTTTIVKFSSRAAVQHRAVSHGPVCAEPVSVRLSAASVG